MAKPLLPPALNARIVGVLNDRHGSALRNERLTVEAREIGDNVVCSLTLASLDRTFVYRMEAAVQRDKYAAMTAEQALDLGLDFLDWYLGEFFRTQRDLLLPLDWKPHRFGDVEVMAKGDLRNELLDDAADAWLRGERPDIEATYKQLKRRK